MKRIVLTRIVALPSVAFFSGRAVLAIPTEIPEDVAT